MMKLVIFLVCALSCVATAWSRTKICDRRPTINGLCVTSTLGIYYDAETERCKYLGCSTDKRIFSTLQDCERICNSARRRRLRRVNGKSASQPKN